jgi:hypothetical protein
VNKNTPSAGKGVNPQYATEEYRTNPFWEGVERRKEIKKLRYAINFESMSQAERDEARSRLHVLEWEEAKQEHKHLWGKEE